MAAVERNLEGDRSAGSVRGGLVFDMLALVPTGYFGPLPQALAADTPYYFVDLFNRGGFESQ